MKVSELTGAELDYWVAKAQGWEYGKDAFGDYWQAEFPQASNKSIFGEPLGIRIRDYYPTINWQQCGELIEKFNADVFYVDNGNRWSCRVVMSDWTETGGIKNITIYRSDLQYGSTPQEAICRVVVASVYGKEVPAE